MKERLRLLANIAIIILLSINMFQTSGLAHKVNQIQSEQKQQLPTIEVHLKQIDSSILKLNEVHPSLKRGGK